MVEPLLRPDGRAPDMLRRHRITLGVMKHAEGSALVEFGDTRVLCSISVEERVPPFLNGSGKGWVTAEYAMLPRATETRNARDNGRGKPNGRALEIGRLIGRALRATLDFEALGERTLWVDCDVIQADGGTRTASITGAYAALVAALAELKKRNKLAKPVLINSVAAISVGMYKGVPVLDLNYPEDRDAESDVNVVMTGDGKFVEIQGTAESAPFDQGEMDEMLALARQGIASLQAKQREVLAAVNRPDIWVPGHSL